MLSRISLRLISLLILAAIGALSASAQYGGGGSTGGSGSSGTYSAPSGGYSSATGIAIGVAAAAGVAIAYFALHNRATLVGCVEDSAAGLKLTNESDKRTYALESGGSQVKAGDRMALKGKKSKSKSGQAEFTVTKVAKDFGSCDKAAAASADPQSR